MITRTSVITRPSTLAPFYHTIEAAQPEYLKQLENFAPLYNDGSATKTESISADGLTMTRTIVYTNIDALSQGETISNNIACIAEFVRYKNEHNYPIPLNTNPGEYQSYWSISGIDQPFKLVNTYTFLEPNDFNKKQFATTMESYEHFNKLTDLLVTDMSVVLEHQYLNSADQTAHPFVDASWMILLAQAGVTRTIKYELL